MLKRIWKYLKNPPIRSAFSTLLQMSKPNIFTACYIIGDKQALGFDAVLSAVHLDWPFWHREFLSGILLHPSHLE
jgi:hypothetical protein